MQLPYTCHAHTASSLPLGARFIWGIKNPLSPDPIDIWASISEIITTSGQNPAACWAAVAPQCDQEGAVLCLEVCVRVFVLYSRYTHAQVRVCRDVKAWKSDSVPFCISPSGTLSSAWMEVWTVTVGGKKPQLSLRQALPIRVSPFETQCPAYPPKAPFD